MRTKERYVKSLCSMLKNPILSPSAKLVFQILKMHTNKANTCFLSYTTISKETNYSRPTVVNAIKELEYLGVIAKLHKSSTGKSNDYMIFDHDDIWIQKSVEDVQRVASQYNRAMQLDFDKKKELSPPPK